MGATGGTPSVTMQDVAARAGVSRALVSIVFRGVSGASAATRERVFAAAAELDYRPDHHARLLGRKRSRTIGVVFALPQEFHGELVDHLYATSESTEYDLALGAVTPAHDEGNAVRSMVDYRVEALILIGPTLQRARLAELAARTPTVVVARAIRGTPVDVVRTDDVAGARIAVEHLVSRGHQAIVHVDGGTAAGAAERRRGYRAAMRGAGLGEAEHIVGGGITDADGEAAGQALLAAKAGCTAVAAFNDHCAAGLIATMRAAGVRVPGDLSVVGFDNSHIAGLATLALTTIAQDGAALAAQALDRAIARADGLAGAPQESLVAPRLVVRGTTSNPLE
ncbi:LacI family DNA-binding transcriptional regulator [Angustibacter sp. McL0619]|uniref:LacI family DNA-binding transcriptional regulator n=1 Tax=Angustibacter sp. McL0619 TaxID=3415676 RepID=UPI003CF1D66C